MEGQLVLLPPDHPIAFDTAPHPALGQFHLWRCGFDINSTGRELFHCGQVVATACMLSTVYKDGTSLHLTAGCVLKPAFKQLSEHAEGYRLQILV